MEYQKLVNDSYTKSTIQIYKKNWVEINDDTRGRYNTNSEIKFKTTMLNSSSFNYNYAYMLVKGTVSFANTIAAAAVANNANKKLIFKNCETLSEAL